MLPKHQNLEDQKLLFQRSFLKFSQVYVVRGLVHTAQMLRFSRWTIPDILSEIAVEEILIGVLVYSLGLVRENPKYSQRHHDHGT